MQMNGKVRHPYPKKSLLPRFWWISGAAFVLSIGAAVYFYTHAKAAYALCALVIALLSLIRSGVEFVLLTRPTIRLERAIADYLRITHLKGNVLEDMLMGQPVERVLNAVLQEQLRERRRQGKEAVARQETELYALQSQINPHFLYNTLDSIRGFALVRDVEEIASMAGALSNLFRHMVAKQGQLIRLSDELEIVFNYMEIQQFRFNQRFHYVCDVDRELSQSYMVPNLVLQPIVENGIMHGLENKLGKGTIRIGGHVTQTRLVLSVSDDGIGMDDESVAQLNRRLSAVESGGEDAHSTDPRHSGIALTNINQRIQLQFGEQYGLYVMSTPGVGTTVEITLPVNKADQTQGNLYE